MALGKHKDSTATKSGVDDWSIREENIAMRGLVELLPSYKEADSGKRHSDPISNDPWKGSAFCESKQEKTS
eukprot:gene4135-4687_t